MHGFANEIRECRELIVFWGGDIGGVSMKIYFPLLACALMLVVSEKAHSTEYLSNLSESTEGYAIVGGSGEYKYAQSFWSGDDSGGYSLTSVTLLMAESSTKSSPLYVSLYISSGSQVGTKIGELTTGNRYSNAGGGILGLRANRLPF